MSDFSEVGRFHQKFGLPVVNEVDRETVNPKLVPREVFEFRLRFLREELRELTQAYEDGDLEVIADSLVDLVYVALGTAHFHGLPWEELFAEVQRANLSKERAVSSEHSKRGSSLDVVKPAGWTPPQVGRILLEHATRHLRETRRDEQGNQ